MDVWIHTADFRSRPGLDMTEIVLAPCACSSEQAMLCHSTHGLRQTGVCFSHTPMSPRENKKTRQAPSLVTPETRQAPSSTAAASSAAPAQSAVQMSAPTYSVPRPFAAEPSYAAAPSPGQIRQIRQLRMDGAPLCVPFKTSPKWAASK